MIHAKYAAGDIALHSTMSLLNPSKVTRMDYMFFFTFHNVSIKLNAYDFNFAHDFYFTFHNVSIKFDIM